MTFGEKLQALRKARGWSQEELATQINVSRQALSKWESGASVPDTENVVALSRLFGVSTDYLLLENGETTAQAAPTAAPSAESKWPIMRIVWLFTMILAILGKIALRIWASTLPPTVIANGTEVIEEITGVRNLSYIYDVDWLILLLWGMLIVGFIGTVFYKKLRANLRAYLTDNGWLK